MPADGQDRVGEPLAHLAVDASDDAEVDEGDDVAGQDEDVAGMRIGVEQAVDENLLQHGVRAAARDEPCGPGPAPPACPTADTFTPSRNSIVSTAGVVSGQ